MKKEDLAEAKVNAIRDQDLVDKRRNQILDGALALFLEKGFASTTIRDICAKSGVNQASLYDYVANKQDILRRAMNRVWFQRSDFNVWLAISDTLSLSALSLSSCSRRAPKAKVSRCGSCPGIM